MDKFNKRNKNMTLLKLAEINHQIIENAENNIYNVIYNISDEYTDNFETDEQIQKNMKCIEVLRTYIIMYPKLAIKIFFNYKFKLNKLYELSSTELDEQYISKYIRFIWLAIKNIDTNFMDEKIYSTELEFFYKKYSENIKKISLSTIKDIIHNEINNVFSNLKLKLRNNDVRNFFIIIKQFICKETTNALQLDFMPKINL